MAVRFATIGTNLITDHFLEALQDVSGCKLEAVYSRSMEKADAYARKHGATRSFDSLEALAACSEIDAVYIASPTFLHAAQTIQMLEGGKHVLVEKPAASNAAEFRQMKAATRENNCVLLEAMRNIHSPGFRCMQDHLKKLGTVRRAYFEFFQYSSRYDKFKAGIIENAFRPELSNGALMDIGVYCLQPMLILFGMPEDVSAFAVRLHNGLDGAGSVLMRYPDMIGEIAYSKITDSALMSEIQGEDGVMSVSQIASPLHVEIHARSGGSTIMEIPQVSNNMIYEIETFRDLFAKKETDNRFLKYTEEQMTLLDRIRHLEGISFPADQSVS